MEKPYQATLVSHTHWDRAWYVTFQGFRIRLVRLVDRLLDLLETRPDYRGLHARRPDGRAGGLPGGAARASGQLQACAGPGASRWAPGTCWPTSSWSAPRR